MAQAQAGMLFFQQRLLDSASNGINKAAAAMADRFSRIFARQLRALRDLRRYAPTVVVQNAGLRLRVPRVWAVFLLPKSTCSSFNPT
jgi:hypothetical protein